MGCNCDFFHVDCFCIDLLCLVSPSDSMLLFCCCLAVFVGLSGLVAVGLYYWVSLLCFW